MGFSRQEYWSGLPCPPPGNLPNLGIKPGLLHLLHCRQILYCWATRKPLCTHSRYLISVQWESGDHRMPYGPFSLLVGASLPFQRKWQPEGQEDKLVLRMSTWKMRKLLLTVGNLFKLLILLLNLFKDSLEKPMLGMLPFTIQMHKINNGIWVSWRSCWVLTPDESLLFIFSWEN